MHHQPDARQAHVVDFCQTPLTSVRDQHGTRLGKGINGMSLGLPLERRIWPNAEEREDVQAGADLLDDIRMHAVSDFDYILHIHPH